MLWEKAMRAMLTDIEELEGKAFIGDKILQELLRPAAVLTADKRLPKDLTMDPELMVVGSSSMMVAQRFYYGRTKKTKEAKAKKEDAQAMRTVAPPPKPEPTKEEITRMAVEEKMRETAEKKADTIAKAEARKVIRR